MSDALLRALIARIRTFLEEEDASGILDPAATKEVNELTQISTTESGISADTAVAASCIYLCRIRALSSGQVEDDQLSVLMIPKWMLMVAPGQLSDELREIFVKTVSGTSMLEQLEWQAFEFLDGVDGIGYHDSVNMGVSLMRVVLFGVSPGHPDHNRLLSSLGAALRMRSEWTNRLADLDEAIILAKQVMELTASDDPDHTIRLNNLLRALHERFIWEGNPGHSTGLREGITLARQALAVTPSDQPDRPNIAFSLFDLSVELRVWFGKSNDAAGLDGLSESIDVGRQALAASKRNDPLQVYILSNLGRSLYEWFERTRETASLNEAIGLFRQAIEAANIYEDLIDATDPAAKLAQALWTRFEQMGDAADLHEAIALGRQVVAATPPEDPSLASRQTYLVEALRARFSHAGEQDGLNEAIGLARQALGAISPDHPSFFEDGLNEAIGLARQALGATSPDHPSFIERAASLAKTLRARFERTQDVADLDEAITLFRKGMTIELEEVYTAALFAQLGRSLLMRFQKLGDVRDLDEAVALCQQAVKIVPPEHPERAGCLLDLGETLEARFTRTNSSVDLSNAIMAWKAATGHRTGMTWLRLKAARRWAQLAANIDNFQLATEGYSAALELLPLVAWHGGLCKTLLEEV